MNCCGECKFNKRDWSYNRNYEFTPDFFCGNDHSDNYGYYTTYSDNCDEYEGKGSE